MTRIVVALVQCSYHKQVDTETEAAQVAKRVRDHRVAMFLTQEELSVQSGVSRPTIARIESGATVPRSRTVKKLAEALNVAPKDIVERPDLLWGSR